MAKIKQEEETRSLVKEEEEDCSSQKVKLNSMATPERGSCWCVWLRFLQIHFVNWTNTFCNWLRLKRRKARLSSSRGKVVITTWVQVTMLTNTICDLDKYKCILHFGQIQSAIFGSEVVRVEFLSWESCNHHLGAGPPPNQGEPNSSIWKALQLPRAEYSWIGRVEPAWLWESSWGTKEKRDWERSR